MHVITVPEISSSSIDAVPGSSDQNQGMGGKHPESFADLFATAKAAVGKPVEKPVVRQDNLIAIDLVKKGIAATTSSPPSAESMPTKVSPPAEANTPQTALQTAEGQESQNSQDPRPPAKTEGLNAMQGEAIKQLMEGADAASGEQLVPGTEDASSIKPAKPEGENVDPEKAPGKDKGIHTKTTHKLILVTSPAAQTNTTSAQLSTSEATSKAPMTPPDVPQAAVIPAAVSTLPPTQSAVGKDALSTAATPRTSAGLATVVGKQVPPPLAGEEAPIVGRISEPKETVGHAATTDNQDKVTADGHSPISSGFMEPATSGLVPPNPEVSGFKDTQALQQMILPPVTHGVAPSPAKVAVPGGTDIASPLRHVQSDATTSNPPGQIRMLSERTIEISVSDSQHGAVSVRAEMRNDGSVAAVLLPQSDAGHQSLVSQTNGLSAFLSEHGSSVSVSVIAPTAPTGGNLPAGNSSGQTQSDGMQFTQHREEREPQAQRNQSDEEFIHSAVATHRGEEGNWQIAQTSTTQQTGRHGWISIHV